MSYTDELGLFVELDHNGLAMPGVKPTSRSAPKADGVVCPICSEILFDNRAYKSNPRAPDWSCDRACGFVMWPGQTNLEKAALAWMKKKGKDSL